MKFVTCSNFDWQYPVISEKFAYECLLADPDFRDLESIYIAFPWATIIDIYHKDWKKYNNLDDFLDQNLALPSDGYNNALTVCQTYNYRKFLPYFQKVGITILFTPHATLADFDFYKKRHGIEILPFPIYPVNSVNKIREKDIFYSFIGSLEYKGIDTDNVKRVSDLRRAMVEEVSHPNNSLIVSRDKWHFDNTVYKNQIFGQNLKKEEVDYDQNKSIIYQEILSRSIFSLCPRGIGPSSIRFWESIMSGSIPVVIADDFWLPAGNTNWEDCIVKINESDVLDIPARLSKFSKQDIANKQSILRQAEKEFLGSNFISPIKNKVLSEVASQLDSVAKIHASTNSDESKTEKSEEENSLSNVRKKLKRINAEIKANNHQIQTQLEGLFKQIQELKSKGDEIKNPD